MAGEIISGVGVRHGAIFNLDTATGLPLPATASAVPMQGTLIEGIKSLSSNDSAPQRIPHYGEDRAFAQDALPPAEAGSFQIMTSKTNLTLDAMIEGGKVRTINSNKFRLGNTDNRGQEPQMMAVFYRQALDTKKGSATLGKLRQWDVRFYPAVQISRQTPSFEQGAADITYNATPSPVTVTPWNEVLDETNWGAVEGDTIHGVMDWQPRENMYRGDGTIVAFQLSHPPKDPGSITVWTDGTETAPDSVVVTSANPAFTMASAPAVNTLVFALIETNEPGTS